MAKAINSRAQWCAVAQASSPTRQGGSGKEREHLAAPQPLTHHHVARLFDRLNLENILC